MALEAECGSVRECNALQGSVEQRAVCRFHIIGKCRLVDREAMILAGNHHLIRAEVLHRVVGTMVTEFHFFRLGTGRERQKLMSQANSEYGNTLGQEILDRGDGIVTGFRVARTIREEDTIGL